MYSPLPFLLPLLLSTLVIAEANGPLLARQSTVLTAPLTVTRGDISSSVPSTLPTATSSISMTPTPTMTGSMSSSTGMSVRASSIAESAALSAGTTASASAAAAPGMVVPGWEVLLGFGVGAGFVAL